MVHRRPEFPAELPPNQRPLRRLAVCSGPLLLGLLTAACCHRSPATPPPGPLQAAARYAGRLAAGDIASARELVAAEQRERLTAADLEAFVSGGGAELQAALEELQAAPRQLEALDYRAVLQLADGRRLVLARRQGAWRVIGGELLPGRFSSPERALMTFLKAIDDGDCMALARCAPPQVRAEHPVARLARGCSEQLPVLRETAAAIRDAGGRPIQVEADRAQLPYGERRRVVLVRREGRWYVQDL